MFQKRTIAPSMNGERTMPDPEVPVKAKRRTFSAVYKLRILEEADNCREPGEVGALLRREGLYSSNLTKWRRQREAGGLDGLKPKKRGRKKDAGERIRQRNEAEPQRTLLRVRAAQAGGLHHQHEP